MRPPTGNRPVAIGVIAAAVVGLAGCLPVPAPGAASIGRRETGADYTATAVGRWACADHDFVVAKDKKGPLLHELNLDIVARSPKAADGGQVFEVSDGVTSLTITVPDDPAKAAKVEQTIATTSAAYSGLQSTGGTGMQNVHLEKGNESSSAAVDCPPAPPVRLL